MKKIAILLTVYNRKEKTLSCLKSVYEQYLPEYVEVEVFLTNDGCTDGTQDAIRKLFPKVNIVEGTGGLFWNRGMYLAWVEASKAEKFDYYLWLNDDTNLFQGAINQLLFVSNEKFNKSIIVGSTYDPISNEINYGGRDFSMNLIPNSPNIQECVTFNGNIVLIPYYVFNILKFNEYFFKHSLGDFDYGLRAYKNGIKCYVAPNVLGSCNSNYNTPLWRDSHKSFIQRWKAFRSPLGNDPEEHFKFEHRHFGIFKASFHYFTNHLRVLFPSIWSILKK